MKPHLTTDLARRLRKDELDDGTKMGQHYSEKAISEYNKRSRYNNSHYSVSGFDNIDASVFTPIPTASWAFVLQKVKSLSLEYEKAYNKSKESGYHGDFDDLEVVKSQPFLLYFNQMLEESSDPDSFRSALLAELPDDVYHDSGAPQQPQGKKQRRGGKGGDRSGGGNKKGSSNKDKRGESAALESIANKNIAHEKKITVETNAFLDDQMEKCLEKKEEAMNKFTAHCGGNKKVAKKRVKEYAERQNAKKSEQSADDSSSDSSDDDDDPESQVTICKTILRLGQRRKELGSQIKQLNNPSKKSKK